MSKTRSDRWLSICYWNRLVNMSASRLTHNMFELDYKLSEEKNASLSSKIRAIIYANGFEEKYISKLQCNLEIVKSRIKNKDIESWHSDLSKKTKLRTYITFKYEVNVEPYLLNPIQKCQCQKCLC